jgi:hypothetical protein
MGIDLSPEKEQALRAVIDCKSQDSVDLAHFW